MPLIRFVAALVLLASFAVGGILAPAVHQVEHALEFVRRIEAERQAHSDHQHDGEQAIEAAIGSVISHAPCPFCHSRWSGIVEGLSSTNGLQADHLTGHIPDAPPGLTFEHLSIRGPPTVA